MLFQKLYNMCFPISPFHFFVVKIFYWLHKNTLLEKRDFSFTGGNWLQLNKCFKIVNFWKPKNNYCMSLIHEERLLYVKKLKPHFPNLSQFSKKYWWSIVSGVYFRVKATSQIVKLKKYYTLMCFVYFRKFHINIYFMCNAKLYK